MDKQPKPSFSLVTFHVFLENFSIIKKIRCNVAQNRIKPNTIKRISDTHCLTLCKRRIIKIVSSSFSSTCQKPSDNTLRVTKKSTVYGPVHTTSEKFENAALFLWLHLP